MTAWLLIAAAITAALVALCAELLARRTVALAALAAGFGCVATAASVWGDTWATAACEIATLVLAALAAASAVRRKLPPYAVGSDDENEA